MGKRGGIGGIVIETPSNWSFTYGPSHRSILVYLSIHLSIYFIYHPSIYSKAKERNRSEEKSLGKRQSRNPPATDEEVCFVSFMGIHLLYKVYVVSFTEQKALERGERERERKENESMGYGGIIIYPSSFFFFGE